MSFAHRFSCVFDNSKGTREGGSAGRPRDFWEVALVSEGQLRSAGRIAARPEALELFGQSLDPRDWVALEVTGNAWAIAQSSSATRGAGDRGIAE